MDTIPQLSGAGTNYGDVFVDINVSLGAVLVCFSVV